MVAAKDKVLDDVIQAADRGVPVIGICNGAQVLVETGIVPGFEHGRIDVALAPNKMTGRVGYYCNWVHVKKGPAKCLFTDFMAERPNDPLPIPLAHGEGRFVTSNETVRAHFEKGDGVALDVLHCTRRNRDDVPRQSQRRAIRDRRTHQSDRQRARDHAAPRARCVGAPSAAPRRRHVGSKPRRCWLEGPLFERTGTGILRIVAQGVGMKSPSTKGRMGNQTRNGK